MTEFLTQEEIVKDLEAKFLDVMKRETDPFEAWVIENTVWHTLEYLQNKGYIRLEITKPKREKPKEKAEIFKHESKNEIPKDVLQIA
jgi:hypothetical protein